MEGSVRSSRFPRRDSAPRLSIGFILAHRFTLCAFGNFVDVLRLAADEGDRSRLILCDWTVLSDTMNPVVSSCGVPVQPTERLGDPTKFNYIVVAGGLIDEISNLEMRQPDCFEQERHGDLNRMVRFFKAMTESNKSGCCRIQEAKSRFPTGAAVGDPLL
jgi:hypothetical protein